MIFNHKTMTEEAALALRKGILQGSYPSGTRLVPAKLEEELQLSRTAIREAIRELVGTGLADSETHKGACVAEPLELEEIRSIFNIRYQLEGEAAFRGTRQISSQSIETMEYLLDQMSSAETSGRYVDFLLNQQFHVVLYQAAGWRYLVKVIDRMFDQVLVFRAGLYKQFTDEQRDTLLTRESFKPYHDDHVKIMSFVKKGDQKGTRKAVVDNLKRGFADLEKIVCFLEDAKT
ncbi:MAG: GntR family transcriptional regulator [Deltaproteobacteria bacterium]|jgi:DNA-binding GntR family transcriptional regulator|nr:GntR family transcriptional regulator [Deltaproteobacteria bacterium]MBT6500805.1 GntR family transcriptional regulator [Deltaproteobacteria bacterium]